LREITPFLCQLPLQVFAIESCKLTDNSWPYIASILKVSPTLLFCLYFSPPSCHCA
jgi:hypothetical protein